MVNWKKKSYFQIILESVWLFLDFEEVQYLFQFFNNILLDLMSVGISSFELQNWFYKFTYFKKKIISISIGDNISLKIISWPNILLLNPWLLTLKEYIWVKKGLTSKVCSMVFVW